MQGRAFTIGRCVLEPRRQLLVDGAPAAVGRRALDLLSVLAEAQGALVTKDELMAAVWPNTIVEENAIQAQVATLRKALGEDGARLSTVRGLGYRLDAAPAPPVQPSAPDPPGPPAAGPAARALPSLRAPRRRPPAAVLAGALIVVILGAAALIWPVATHSPARTADDGALPADPAAAALFLQARDEWAARDSPNLTRPIAHFERVTKLAPRFAPAFADLADAYLLASEAGSLPDAVAFDGAEHAAASAQKLDPQLAGAHRAQGFILYWWRRDRPGAADAFHTALRLDPAAAQTHFWYANVLADNGESAAALREFDRARLADPGSDQIAADYAWAQWSAGREAEAIAALRAIVARSPGNAEAQDCLATALLAEGDAQGYLRGLQARASLRQEAGLNARVQALARTYAAGGARALLEAEAAREMAAQADSPYPDHAAAAFYASLANDRQTLLAALEAADAGRESWGSAGFVLRIRARWAGDAAVRAALDRRAAPPLEAPG